MKRLLLAGVLASLSTVSLAQDAVVATVTQKDAIDLDKLLSEQTPAKWAAPMAEWFNKVAKRQQEAEEAKKAEADKSAPKPETSPSAAPEPHKP